MALKMEPDLVVQAPLSRGLSVQSADHFAKGSGRNLVPSRNRPIDFWDRRGLRLQAIATVYSEKRSEMEAFLRESFRRLSYPQKTQNVGTFAGVEFWGYSQS